ncbi:MAG: orotidine-5'-phosphate decarboxylase [Candidatus Hydrogenedentes bacterium]|nr:orotidine-5'-phosphate decarboxylase [Candidatus Hydrogenedentota bacterium]
MSKFVHEKIVIGLDVSTFEEVEAILSLCRNALWFKVGSQLFTKFGPSVVEFIRKDGRKVFLDLKFHDIPNTVKNAVSSAVELGVDLLTLHSLGGRKMIAQAREVVEGTSVKILAVTVLTSHNEQELRNEIGIYESVGDAVTRLAKMAISAGAHGVVCSPQEIRILRDNIQGEFMIVTPGVRPAWEKEAYDQARVMTPSEAIKLGADKIVIARPILKAKNPSEAYNKLVEEIENEL